MLNKTLLVIDNEDQQDVLEGLVKEAQKVNVILDYYQYNIGGPLEPDVLDKDGNLDIEKAKSIYKDRFGKQRFDIIACDYYLDVENINGVELMRVMGVECFGPNPRILMYSGLLREVIKEQVAKNCEIMHDEDGNNFIAPNENFIKVVSHLINSNYLGFVDRTQYCKAVQSHLKEDIRIDDIFIDVCNMHPELVLQYNLGRQFNERKLSECKIEILKNEDLRIEVMQDLVQQTIMYLTKYLSKRE